MSGIGGVFSREESWVEFSARGTGRVRVWKTLGRDGSFTEDSVIDDELDIEGKMYTC
jgi:hypothetical protein